VGEWWWPLQASIPEAGVRNARKSNVCATADPFFHRTARQRIIWGAIWGAECRQRELAVACDSQRQPVSSLFRGYMTVTGTAWPSMVRRRSTVRFRKGAPGHGSFSSIQPGTFPSESATRVALMTPLRLALSTLFLEMEHCRASPAPGRGTRLPLRPQPTRRPPPLSLCALDRVCDTACPASLCGSRMPTRCACGQVICELSRAAISASSGGQATSFSLGWGEDEQVRNLGWVLSVGRNTVWSWLG
jgi:hypothetical protein